MLDTRLNNAVQRGAIDNTTQGLTLLSLWIVDRNQPIEIRLSGNCLKDLAGTSISFLMHDTATKTSATFDWGDIKEGEIGEITASARVIVQKETSFESEPTLLYSNFLRIEFFCEVGRFILESNNFSSTLIKKEWSLSPSDEFAQIASNAALWRQHISSCALYQGQGSYDALADLYDEITSRFADSLDFDQHEVFLMSWDGIMSALSEEGDDTLEEFETENNAIVDISSLEQLPLQPPKEEPLAATFSPQWFETEYPHPVLESLSELLSELDLLTSHHVLPKSVALSHFIKALTSVQISLQNIFSTNKPNARKIQNKPDTYKKPLGEMIQSFAQLSILLGVTEAPSARRELTFIRDNMLDLRDDISELRFQVNN